MIMTIMVGTMMVVVMLMGGHLHNWHSWGQICRYSISGRCRWHVTRCRVRHCRRSRIGGRRSCPSGSGDMFRRVVVIMMMAMVMVIMMTVMVMVVIKESHNGSKF